MYRVCSLLYVQSSSSSLKLRIRLDATIANGRKSFPSGHSSTAFSGMFFLSLLIAGQTASWCFNIPKAPRCFKSSRMGAFVLTILPLFWAIHVAVSRLQDYVSCPFHCFSLEESQISSTLLSDITQKMSSLVVYLGSLALLCATSSFGQTPFRQVISTLKYSDNLGRCIEKQTILGQELLILTWRE